MRGLLLTLLTLWPQEELDEVKRSIDSGDYHGAWELVEAQSDELVRLRGLAALLYEAGDPAGALKSAIAGLETAPTQIDLIYYAASAAIWLEEGAAGIALSTRLLRAAETMERLSGRAWHEAGEELAVRARSIAERDRQLGRSVRRLKLVAIAGTVSWVLGISAALLLQGRSRRPVS